MLNLEIPELVVEELRTLLEVQQGVPMKIKQQIRGVAIEEDNWNGGRDLVELRLTGIGTHTLYVSRINFIRKNCGTFTAVLEILKKLAIDVGIQQIVIQSVCTPDMASYCAHRDYYVVRGTGFAVLDGGKEYVYGDYIAYQAPTRTHYNSTVKPLVLS